MNRKILTKEKEFIKRNFTRLSPRQMANKLGVSTEPVLKYMREKGLKSVYSQYLENNKLTLEQELAIISAAANTTSIKSISIATGIKYNKVAAFIYKRRINLNKPVKKEVEDYEVKEPIVRPPAIYSNKNYAA